MALGVPLALGAGLVRDELWLVGPAWIGVVVLLMLLDMLLARRPRRFRLVPDLPGVIEAGREGVARFEPQGQVPAGLEAVLEAEPLLRAGMAEELWFTLRPTRRGVARLVRLHLRWPGPLGLMRLVHRQALDHAVEVVPQISLVRQEATRMFSRTATGQAVQPDVADSMEFHALREYQAGDDPRGVNWRQSARHGKVLVRETRAERNRAVMLAVDTGRLMSEPLAGGLSRLDHALNASLILAYAGLKFGDRVGLFAFADRPVQSTGLLRGPQAFPALQRLATGLEYCSQETNHTLCLTELGGTLDTRSLVIVMTEFADATGAELMLENVGRLLTRHVVLFVAFQDDELMEMAAAPPLQADDVSRAVVAGSLLAERERVLARLQLLGADVVSAPARALGPALVQRYLELKRRDRL